MNLRLSSACALAAISILFIAGQIHAQTVPVNMSGLQIAPSVSSPTAGQDVTVTATSYNIDANSATIVWTVGGTVVSKGVGDTSITVKAPALGKKLRVSAAATTVDGAVFSSSIDLMSSSVDMIVESSGYAPTPFAGKAPVSYQNDATIVAVPHLVDASGAEQDPASLVYRWEQNGSPLASQSGYGKQSATFPGSVIPRPYVVSVTASTRDGSLQGTGFVSVSPASPFIVFYKNDPLYGPFYNIALSDTLYIGSQREASVLAAPYGFDIPAAGAGSMGLSWLINGKAHDELSHTRSITLRAPDSSAGVSSVELDIAEPDKVLQAASASFRAVFSDSSASSGSASGPAF